MRPTSHCSHRRSRHFPGKWKQFFADASAFTSCVSAKAPDGIRALCNCTDDYGVYLHQAHQCWDMLPQTLRTAINTTRSQFDEACSGYAADGCACYAWRAA